MMCLEATIHFKHLASSVRGSSRLLRLSRTMIEGLNISSMEKSKACPVRQLWLQLNCGRFILLSKLFRSNNKYNS